MCTGNADDPTLGWTAEMGVGCDNGGAGQEVLEKKRVVSVRN